MKTRLTLLALASGLGALTGLAQEILPFLPTPSASIAGLMMQDSTFQKCITPSRLQPGAPNILIILIDDVGLAMSSTSSTKTI